MYYGKEKYEGLFLDDTPNHFIGSNLNKELFLDIISMKGNASRFDKFKKKYNLSYLGEILERYEERKLVKTQKDFRAVLFAADYLFENHSPEYNTNQVEVFVNKAIENAVKSKDLLSIGCLIYACKFRPFLKDKKMLSEIILNELESNDDILFEERVWSLYSCWNLISHFKNRIDYKKDDEECLTKDEYDAIYSKFLNILTDTEIKALKDKSDYYLYFMLIQIVSVGDILKKASNFKKKTIYNQFKMLVSLAKKEYNKYTIENVMDVINIGSKNDLLFYNYVLAMEGYSNNIISNSASWVGVCRIGKAIAAFLEEDKKCPEIILNCIKDRISRIEEEVAKIRNMRYYYRNEAAIDEYFSMNRIKVSPINMTAFLDILGDDKDYDFFSNEDWSYLLGDEYKDFYDKLRAQNRNRIERKCLEDSNDAILVKAAYEKIKERDEGFNIKETLNMYELKVLDTTDENIYFSTNSYEAYLKYAIKTSSMRNVLDKMKEFYSKCDEVEKYYKSYQGKRKFILDVNYVIYKFLNSIDIYELAKSDKELAREFCAFKDEVVLLNKNEWDYCRYLNDNIKNPDYVSLMNLSEDDIAQVIRAIYKIIANKKIPSRYTSAYQGDLEFFNEIKSKAMTKEEKEEEIRLKNEKLKMEEEEKARKKERDKQIRIDNLRFSSGPVEFFRLIDNEDFNKEQDLSNMKQIFMSNLKKSSFINTSSDVFNGYKVVDKLIKHGLFDENELMEFSKVCLNSVQ